MKGVGGGGGGGGAMYLTGLGAGGCRNAASHHGAELAVLAGMRFLRQLMMMRMRMMMLMSIHFYVHSQ